jgi:hypothetical protein
MTVDADTRYLLAVAVPAIETDVIDAADEVSRRTTRTAPGPPQFDDPRQSIPSPSTKFHRTVKMKSWVGMANRISRTTLFRIE